MFCSESFHFALPADVTEYCYLRNFADLAYVAHCSVSESKHVRYDDDDTSVDPEAVHLSSSVSLLQ